LTVQLVDIYYTDVFRRYSAKYNIYRDLYEKDLLGIEIREVDFKLAQSIKNIILVNKQICYNTGKKGDRLCDFLVIGSIGVFRELAKEIIAIGNEDLGFKVSQIIKNNTDYDSLSLTIADKEFNLNNAYTFGILNVTPDSFSDGGNFSNTAAAVEHGIKLLEDGADIIDIGGESTRPGADPVDEKEELKRVIPVIRDLLKARPDALISIDTTKSNVANEALLAGAKIVNDISSFGFDGKMIDIVKRHEAAAVLMHMRGNPKTMQNDPDYTDLISEIYDFLTVKTENAKRHGIKNIIIDPGIGFGKTVSDNYEIIKRLNEFKGVGQPILIGLSRKSFLGRSLELKIDERENATLIVETIALKNGARFIRTHDVSNTIQAAKINRILHYPESV
jgi:dihydropteroate synthase